MNKTIKNYIEETDKLFEEEFIDIVSLETKGNLLRNRYLGKDIKSFLHERQIGLVEVVKGLMPEERKVEYYPQAYIATDYELQEQQRAMGHNSCRYQILKNLEI